MAALAVPAARVAGQSAVGGAFRALASTRGLRCSTNLTASSLPTQLHLGYPWSPLTPSSASSGPPKSNGRRPVASGATVELHSFGALRRPTQATCVADELPPVLCLHGLMGSSRNLQAWAALLAKQLQGKRAVLMADLRNHGQSGHADSMTYADLAADVIGLMDQKQIERASIIGHSMGGKVAAALALLYPTRIETITLLDIAPVRYDGPESRPSCGSVWTTGADVVKVLMDLPLERFSNRLEVDKYMTGLQANFPPWFVKFALSSLERKDGKWCWRVNLPAIRNHWNDIAGFDVAGRFQGPALLVRGSTSQYISSTHDEALASLLPGHHIQTLEGAGHFLHTEDPAGLLRIVQPFLA